MLGKVNYFYKESKSNIKEKKGWGMMVGGGLELVIFLTMKPNLK